MEYLGTRKVKCDVEQWICTKCGLTLVIDNLKTSRTPVNFCPVCGIKERDSIRRIYADIHDYIALNTLDDTPEGEFMKRIAGRLTTIVESDA